MQVKAVFKILIAAVILAVAYFGWFLPSEQQHDPISNGQSSAPDISPPTGLPDPNSAEPTNAEVDSDPAEGEAVSNGSRTSYRIRTDQEEVEITYAITEIDWENETEARAALDSALSGNADDAVAVSELVRKCSVGFANEQQVRRRLDNDSKQFMRNTPFSSKLSSGTGDKLQFADFEEYEEHLWSQFAQCDSTRGLLDEQLRERLVLMAQNGSVTARYLYAMWRPDQAGGGSGAMLDWLTYQELALAFTMDNMKVGEPLGLLAYGRSLESLHPAYFTPTHSAYGQAFTMAAQKCGLNNGMINQKVANMTELWNQRQMDRHLGQIELLADRIVELFCKVTTP